MKKLLAGTVGTVLALGGISVATATPAAAAVPDVQAGCSSLYVTLDGYPDGTAFVATVDGETVDDVVFDGYHTLWYDVDGSVAHDWSVVVDAPGEVDEDFSDSGTTTPCGEPPSDWFSADAYCGNLNVSLGGFPAGSAVTVVVDAEVVSEGLVDEYGSYWFGTRLDEWSGQTWQVVVDAEDDAFDRSESGVSSCGSGGEIVVPETPSALTDCAATPQDVHLPPDTAQVSYARGDDGIVATAAAGYEFPGGAGTTGEWRALGDGRLLLEWYSVVRPRCALDVVSVTPVCEAGEPFVDIAVDPPAGVDESSFLISWEGPNTGYDVVYGDAGFGHPWVTREPWPGFVTHGDGTVSPAYDETWRLDDIDLVLGASAWVDGWAYSRSYGAVWEDAPTADPCADDPGPHFSVDVSPRWLAGKLYLSVRVLNEGDSTADVSVVTPFGRKHFPRVEAGASAYQAFAVRTTEPVEGQVDVSFAADVDGEQVTRERSVAFSFGG
ncbi:hypothetical protein ABRQ22_06230 [Cellulosimicrobium sp. ES-005]|uniref:CARDB domain-containing protein n=1 Tax=Cellulosimicrobium sp. ES-005 TaxID=3163031 RepID=A0AAU8G2X8_9MICO